MEVPGPEHHAPPVVAALLQGVLPVGEEGSFFTPRGVFLGEGAPACRFQPL